MRSGQRGGQRRNMICFTVGPVESTFLLVLLKLCCYHVLLMGKKFVLGYICITICVHVSIKAGGLGCTGWGWGLSPQRANTPHVTYEYFYVKVVVFFVFFISLLSEALRLEIYVYVQQLLLQIKFV